MASSYINTKKFISYLHYLQTLIFFYKNMFLTILFVTQNTSISLTNLNLQQTI